jgi:CubicO group peptidase (beta-lactamase class C family)
MSMPAYDDLAEDWRRLNDAPALSVAVLHRGTLLHAAGYGSATAGTPFQTASVGKHFTAVMVLLLSSAGELPPLDDPVSQSLPELPSSWQAITFRHLLSHTAGIPAEGYDALDFAADYTDSEIAHAIASPAELRFSPGDAWEYSNAGYVLAGLLIGRLTGRFYGDLLHDRIFRPLGMTTAAVTAPGAPPGFCRENGSLVPAAYVSPSLNRLADGGLTMSVLDFARWEAALCGDWGRPVARMFDETLLNNGAGCGYGLGWNLRSTPRGRVASHAGGWQGYSTAFVRYLDQGLSAIVLSNIDDADASTLAHALAT